MRLLYAGIVLVAIFACSSGLPAPEPEINDDGNLVYLEESDFIKEGDLPEEGEEVEEVEEADDEEVDKYILKRAKRASCDLLSGFGVAHSACAARCVLFNKRRGGFCNSRAICECR